MGIGIAGTVATSKRRAMYAAVSADEVYAIHDRSRVDVLDASTGKWKRSVKLEASEFELGLREVPGTALHDGLIYARDGRIFDTRTGRERFVVPNHEQAIGLAGRRLVACLDENTVISHDLRTGNEIWRRSLRCRRAQGAVSESVVAL